VISRSGEALGIEAGIESLLDDLPAAARDLLSEDVLVATAGFGRSAATAISYGFVALVATVFLVVRPYPVVDGFVTLFPAGRRERVREVLSAVYRTVQRWLLGQLVAMAFIGLSTTIALWLLGVPFALLLGIFSGLISFVPFLGALVSAVPPILLALVSDPVLALWVVVAYTAIQQVESQVIQPVVMSHAVALHPAVVLFGLVLMGSLFGVVGLLLAVPVVATVQVLMRELWVRRMDGAGTDPRPPSREQRRNEPRRRLRKLVTSLKKASQSAKGESRW
jgi:predicted PurR-regulated permease PerM